MSILILLEISIPVADLSTSNHINHILHHVSVLVNPPDFRVHQASRSSGCPSMIHSSRIARWIEPTIALPMCTHQAFPSCAICYRSESHIAELTHFFGRTTQFIPVWKTHGSLIFRDGLASALLIPQFTYRIPLGNTHVIVDWATCPLSRRVVGKKRLEPAIRFKTLLRTFRQLYPNGGTVLLTFQVVSQ